MFSKVIYVGYAEHEVYHMHFGGLEISRNLLKTISQTICGFLNQGQGGMVLLGIHDSGQVRGIELTPPQMTHLHYSIQDRIRRFNPPVDPELIQVQFVPVSSSPISSSSEKINCMKKVKDSIFKNGGFGPKFGKIFSDSEREIESM